MHALNTHTNFIGEKMETIQLFGIAFAAFVSFLLWRVLYSWWVLPIRAYRKLKKNGFSGPKPSFPFGNLGDIKKIKNADSRDVSVISNDIHSVVFPYFSQWRNFYGKVFVYWLGTEPFLNIADPEFLREMSNGIMGKSWGKPTVFRIDRAAMFGEGLNSIEGEDWYLHRHIINPAFSPANLKGMANMMVDSAQITLNRWMDRINAGESEIDVEIEMLMTAGDVIARTSFGLSYEEGKIVFEKLRAVQQSLYNSNRYVGVPFAKLVRLNKSDAQLSQLGKEIDKHLLGVITERKRVFRKDPQSNLLDFLLAENEVEGPKGPRLTMKELVDECKTFFFAGHETTALVLTWSLLLLAKHPNWQDELREEILQVIGDKEIDANLISGLKKMGWVFNEVLRLYPSSPNTQRQTRHDIKVGNQVIPSGTNIWIDTVAMHHDREYWGDDVNEFKPERFKDDANGGCYHKMGYLPFGFGGRMCVGRNLTSMEYKVVLSVLLPKLSFSLSPNYVHMPYSLLSLKPKNGVPLIVRPI